jgi:cell division protein FtsL
MIQIIPKPEKLISPEKIFLIFSIFIFLLSLLLFFYLFDSEKKLKKEISNFEEKISASKTEEIKSLEKEILRYQREISDFSKIIETHVFPSKFFQILEKNTHPKVYFSRFDFDLANSKCTLSGTAQDFYTLGQQFDIFKNNRSFQTKLSKISFGKEGKVDFEFEIIFQKEMLK